MSTITKNYNFAFVFMILATLILILHYNITWWAAILVILLANLDFKISTTSTYRRR